MISKKRLAILLITIFLLSGISVFPVNAIEYRRKAEPDIFQPMKELCSGSNYASYENIGYSNQGRETLLFKVGNPAGGKLMITCAIHGDEHASSVTAYWLLDWLLNSNTPEAQRILQNNYVLIVPIVNPDGFDNYDRQNRNFIDCKWGVDLNRNFHTGWKYKEPNLYDYPGPAPLSEMESRNILCVLESYQPNVFIDIHDGGGPWAGYYIDSDTVTVGEVISLYTYYASQYSVDEYPIRSQGSEGYLFGDAHTFGNALSWILEVDVSSDGGNWQYSDEEMRSMYFVKALPLFRALASVAFTSTEFIVDDADAVFTGDWRSSTIVLGYYGSGYRYRWAGTGAYTAEWSLDLPQAGYYEVFAMWTGGPNRASYAPYTVNHADGSTVVHVNQQNNGGQWVSLGVYLFNSGVSNIFLSDNANGVVIADAVRLVSSDATPPPPQDEIIMDDNDATFAGVWKSSSSTPGYFGGVYKYRWAGTGTNTATWGINVPNTGYWEVFAMWTSDTNRATNAPYTINHAVGSCTVPINQQVDGGEWASLGIYFFNEGATTIALSDHSNGVVIADAVKIVLVDEPPPPTVFIVDDADAVFAGDWRYSTIVPGYYGSGYTYRWAGTGANTATWNFNLRQAGEYEVYARWTSYSNRATDAFYTIGHAGGSTPVIVNQEINGGEWVSLGVFPFNEGMANIMLTDDANEAVIADAVKLVFIG